MKRDREGGGVEKILPHPLYILVLSSRHKPFICFFTALQWPIDRWTEISSVLNQQEHLHRRLEEFISVSVAWSIQKYWYSFLRLYIFAGYQATLSILPGWPKSCWHPLDSRKVPCSHLGQKLLAITVQLQATFHSHFHNGQGISQVIC